MTLQTPLSLLALSEGRFGSLLSTRCQVPDQLDKDMVDGLTEENTGNGVMVGLYRSSCQSGEEGGASRNLFLIYRVCVCVCV